VRFLLHALIADLLSHTNSTVITLILPDLRASYSNIAKGCNPVSTAAPMVANTSAQGQDENSTESGIQDGSNHFEKHPVSQQGAISGLSNLKRKIEEIDLERAALKIKQSNLEEEVSTVACSLTKLTEDILPIRRDMTQMSTSLRNELHLGERY
jgi:hypothetical protein